MKDLGLLFWANLIFGLMNIAVFFMWFSWVSLVIGSINLVLAGIDAYSAYKGKRYDSFY